VAQAPQEEAQEEAQEELQDELQDELRTVLWPEGDGTPTRVVSCRHCGLKNRIPVPDAVMTPERIDCGGCSGALFLTREEPFEGLSADAYLHGADRRSLNVLRSVPVVPGLLHSVLRYAGDRPAQLMFLSEAIRCDEEQFPELVALVDLARKRLDFPVKPTVYLGESPHMNALTTGVEEPVVVVRSSLLDQMADDELVAILGHEFGHLHASHPLYRTMASVLLRSGGTAWQPLRLVSLPLHRVFLRWGRAAELTADRAGLLACRSLVTSIRVLLTFAGGNRPGTTDRTKIRMEPFIRQCRELAKIESGQGLDGMLAEQLSMDRTHPHVARRVMHLINWVRYGNYLNILSGDYRRRRPRTY